MKKGKQLKNMSDDIIVNAVGTPLAMLKADLDLMRSKQDMNYEYIKEILSELRETQKEIRGRVNSIEKLIITIQHKQNWKTALWVFLGAGTPTLIMIVYHFMDMGRY